MLKFQGMKMAISPYDTLTQPGNIESPLNNVPSRHVPQNGVHLYHLSGSYYSQIARLVLEEKNVNWVSHQVYILAYEQYDPAYVRINPRCVVPTLVIDGKVTTDAYNICRVVDACFGDGSLIPSSSEEKNAMEKFSSLGKTIFVEALTYGTVPDFKKPLFIRLFARQNHKEKETILVNLIERHKDIPYLKEAYEKKLKILQFTEKTLDSEEDLKAIMSTIYDAMDKIEYQLKTGPFSQGGWLCSQAYSQADIEWSVMLSRFDFLNLGKKLLKTRPFTKRYQNALFSRPAFKKSIVAWGHPFRQIFIPILCKKLTRKYGKFSG
jgi:glutathione S-transferase